MNVLSKRGITCIVALACVALFTTGAALANHNKLPDDFVIDPVLTGFDGPTAMVFADDGTVYVGERRSGKVFAVTGGQLDPSPVLTVNVAAGGDEGLLDLAYLREGPRGWLYVSFTEQGTAANKVMRFPATGKVIGSGSLVIDLGASTTHERVGGGLAIGRDGKLYVSAGDMGQGPDAQTDGNNRGKVLRLNPDGTIPADNPDPASPVFAKGFRDGIGLAAYGGSDALYLTDRGPTTGYDELNAVTAGGNYAWDAHNGPGGGPGYTDPLDSRSPLVGPTRPGVFDGGIFPAQGSDGFDNDLDGTIDERDEGYEDSVFYGCYDTNTIERSVLTGAGLDAQDSVKTFFDPSIEYDGTPDTACPPAWTDVDPGRDGLLYGLAEDTSGTLDGIYRFSAERPGAREVSPAGSLFPLTAQKSGSDVTLNWENTGREAWVGTTRGASQPAEKYTLWEGTLPIGGSYDHQVKLTTDGTAVNDGLLSATLTPASGNTYYLVSAQADNLEGTLGQDATASPAPRPGKGISDYCNEIGWFDNERGDANQETECNGIDDDGDGSIDESCPGRCGPDFVAGDTGAPARLIDQYGNSWTLHDFRGKVIHLDISALDCTYCRQQAPEFRDLYDEYRGRGFVTITALMNSYSDASVIPSEDCATQLQWWIDNFAPGGDDYILCAADDDGDGVADIWEQYSGFLYYYIIFWQRCNGTPVNLYFDQGMVNYESFCGKTSLETTRSTILQKLPGERCE